MTESATHKYTEREATPSSNGAHVEREQLLRFCTQLTGSRDTAEDLVQETMLEAWRHEERLRDSERRSQWLFGIARNVFLRWARRRGRGRDVLTCTTDVNEENIEAGDDVELELERDELAHLLDRAMALLPVETRRILVERYVDDLPQALIAENLGISEGAVGVRLHRGRLALRRVLLTDLREEAATYGLHITADDGWEATRMWCSNCGAAHVSMYRDLDSGTLLSRCPHCGSATSDHTATYLREVQGHTRAMIHSIRSARVLYFDAMREGWAPCTRCGAPVLIQRGVPPQFAGRNDPDHGVHFLCGQCGTLSLQPVTGLALSLPQAEGFWRRNRRMRTSPVQHINTSDRPALLVTFESVTGSDTLDVVFDLEHLDIIRVTE